MKWVRKDITEDRHFLKLALESIVMFLQNTELPHGWQNSSQVLREPMWQNFQGGFTVVFMNHFINIYLCLKSDNHCYFLSFWFQGKFFKTVPGLKIILYRLWCVKLKQILFCTSILCIIFTFKEKNFTFKQQKSEGLSGSWLSRQLFAGSRSAVSAQQQARSAQI